MNNPKNVYCRLCAELKPHIEVTNLQTDEETCQKVVNKLSRFNIVMDFQENILPKTVCLTCVKSLERAFAFVTAVEQAQALLSDFILVQVNTAASDSSAENMFYEPPDNENAVDGFKDEHSRDTMEVDDDDGNNSGSENVHTENMDNIHYSYEIVKEKIGIKDETDEYTDLNNVKNIEENESLNFSDDCTETQYNDVGEKDLNIRDPKLPSALEEKLTKDILITEVNSEPIPPLNSSVYSKDYINNQDYSTMGSCEPHKRIQPIYKTIPSNVLDSTANFEDYINKEMNRLSTVPVECIKKTWMEYEWKCSHCGTLFSNIEELQKHSMLYHNTCNAYQCTDCKIKKQRLNAFIKHVRSHRKYLHYSCYKCFEKFPLSRETLLHKTKIHENSKHICLGCNTSFSSNTELEEHVNKYYKILWYKNRLIDRDNLTCSTCNKVFANYIGLRNHLHSHKEKKRDCVCDRCGKCFDTKPTLRSHMDTHIENSLYQCEICKRTFKTVYTLRYHASIHSGIKPFTCDICSKCFRTKKQIKEHIKCHTDYVPITCTVCNKKFRKDSYLQNHMLQHTGEKPFSCDICPRDFTNLANRNKHMRRRHGIEMGRKRQVKQQTADDTTSSDLATRETNLADLDKMNERKNKIMVHDRKRQRANKKLKKN